jgi:hypothetical protein
LVTDPSIFAFAFLIAKTACSYSSSEDDGIFLCARMTCTETVSGSGASIVFFDGDSFKVIWIHTAPILTNMINDQLSGNPALVGFIDPSVDWHNTIINLENRISSDIEFSLPEPAAVGVLHNPLMEPEKWVRIS